MTAADDREVTPARSVPLATVTWDIQPALAATEARGVERGRTEAAELTSKLSKETTVPTPSDSQDGARRRDDAVAPGRCGNRSPRLWGDFPVTETCDLRAGHAGQHESTDGSSWTRLPDTEAEAELCATVARLEAERAALQPVFDAALAYVRTHRGNVSDEERWSRDERLRDLSVAVRLAAVDQTAPSSPLETPHTADGGEAGVVEGAGGSEAAEAAEAIRAQADDPCRCGHLRGHHTWRGRACQMCYGCPAFEEVLTDG